MVAPTLIGDLYIDAVTQRTYSAPITITSYVIEDGTQLSQHAVEETETLTLDVTLVDDDFVYYGDLDAATKAANKVTSREDKIEALWAIKSAKEPVDIIQADAVYKNFAIIDILADETVKTANAYKATVVMQKVRTATSLTTQVPIDVIRRKKGMSAAAKAAAEKEAAKQAAKEDGGKVKPEASDDKSIVKRAVDAILGNV